MCSSTSHLADPMWRVAADLADGARDEPLETDARFSAGLDSRVMSGDEEREAFGVEDSEPPADALEFEDFVDESFDESDLADDAFDVSDFADDALETSGDAFDAFDLADEALDEVEFADGNLDLADATLDTSLTTPSLSSLLPFSFEIIIVSVTFSLLSDLEDDTLDADFESFLLFSSFALVSVDCAENAFDFPRSSFASPMDFFDVADDVLGSVLEESFSS